MSNTQNIFQDVQAWPKERLAQFLRHVPQIADIMQERVRQDNKFGPQDRPPVEWFLILSEEVGEVAKECVEIQFNDEAHPYANLANYRKELVETAAVALAALLNFDMRSAREVKVGEGPGHTRGAFCGNIGGECARQDCFLDGCIHTAATLPTSPEDAPAETLTGGLLRQIERVTKIEKEYRALGKPGEMAAALMAADLKKAREAMNSGDVAGMVSVFKELEGYSL
jgi:NTP pyrophosphatase (non-canonical NTP hydrolase)